MKRVLAIAVMSIALAGCGIEITESPKSTPDWKSLPSAMEIVCIDGVNYFLFADTSSNHGGKGYAGMSPKFNRDGSLHLCDG